MEHEKQDQDLRPVSRGKILEITPVIRTWENTELALPGASWRLDNEMLGFDARHIIGRPMILWFNEFQWIPGTSGRGERALVFMVRISEAGPEPDMIPRMDVDAARMIVEAIQTETRKREQR